MKNEKRTADMKAFSELLRTEMGTRTQTDFAKKSGVSRELVNRWINMRAVPDEMNLRKIAPLMPGTDLNSLLELCGYDRTTISEQVREMELSVKDALKDMRGLWKSADSIAETAEMLYVPGGKVSVGKRSENGTLEYNAEYLQPLTVKWTFEGYDCITSADLFLADTKGGGVVLLGASSDNCDPSKSQTFRPETDEKSDVPLHWKEGFTQVYRRISSRTAEEKLLMAILGRTTDNHQEAMVAGFGFYCNSTPPLFQKFVMAHASSFCRSSEEIALFRKLTSTGESPEDIFKDYEDPSTECTGVGAVIAVIMNRETGIDFDYRDYCEDTGRSDACVMVSNENPWSSEDDFFKENQNLKLIVYGYVRELGIKEFGMCYSHSCVLEEKQYNTEDFYLTYRTDPEK